MPIGIYLCQNLHLKSTIGNVQLEEIILTLSNGHIHDEASNFSEIVIIILWWAVVK